MSGCGATTARWTEGGIGEEKIASAGRDVSSSPLLGLARLTDISVLRGRCPRRKFLHHRQEEAGSLVLELGALWQ